MPRFFPKGPVKGGLVLWLPMQEIVGGEVKDISGNNNHGTVNGAVIAAGKIGNGLSLDGSNDYIELTDSNDWINGTNNFTYELWIKFNSFTGYDALYSHYAAANSRVEINHNNSLGVLRFEAYPSPGVIIEDWSWTPVTDTWYHVVVTRSESNIIAYVDGNSLGTDTSNPTITNVAAPLRIGLNGADANPIDGIIDEIRIYNRGLSTREINHNYLLKKHYNAKKWLD